MLRLDAFTAMVLVWELRFHKPGGKARKKKKGRTSKWFRTPNKL